MTRAAGILGSDGAVKTLRGKLRSRRVILEERNFRYIDELLSFIAENTDIEAVLISELGLKENHPGCPDALEQLRRAFPSIRIVFIMENPERNYNFEVLCYDRHIYDIFYPSRHTDIDIDAIGSAICIGRIDPENPPPPPPDPDAVPPEPEDRPGILDRIKLPDIKLPRLPDFSAFKKTESTSPRPEPPMGVAARYRRIGIINSSRGMGATTLTVEMARCLRNAGHTVAVMAMDLKADLLVSGLAEQGITVSIPTGDEMDSWEALAEAHDYLIIDFGIIYDFLPSGQPTPAAQRADEARAVQQAREFCDIRFYLTSDEPWHMNKEDPFAGEHNSYTINTREVDASYILQLFGVI
jgi:hypothetical protein